MPYAPGQTTGFNSVSDYLSANQGTLDREASDVNNLVGSELDAGKTAADEFAQTVTGPDYSATPGYSEADQKQNAAQQDAELTKSQGGLRDLLGRTPQGHGATAFDGQLLSAHGGFAGTQQKAQTLHDYLNGVSSAPHPAASSPDQPESTPPPATPADSPETWGAGAGEGTGGSNWTPTPSSGQPAGTSGLRRARSPFTMGGY